MSRNVASATEKYRHSYSMILPYPEITIASFAFVLIIPQRSVMG